MPKLLVVDDSALMRKFFRDLFSEESGYVVEFARNGREALSCLHSFQPDVITLDINMPEMDGLTALSEIMVQRPTPVLMVSSLTQRDALATLEALALGAVDYVGKPGGTISLGMTEVSEDLKRKVKAACRSRIRPRASAARSLAASARNSAATAPGTTVTPRSTPATEALRAGRRSQTGGAASALSSETATLEHNTRSGHFSDPPGVVIIGVSTGGPRVLEEILPELPANLPWPVVVIQHMPAMFTQAFAERLNGHCALHVCEVRENTPLKVGEVYIARGSADAILTRRGGRLCMAPRPEDPREFWHPSVTLMVQSAMKVVPPANLIGVMLTGMGSDGAEAMTELKRLGGRTLAESEESAVVFGMPAELIRRGGASQVAASGEIARHLRRWLM